MDRVSEKYLYVCRAQASEVGYYARLAYISGFSGSNGKASSVVALSNLIELFTG